MIQRVGVLYNPFSTQSVELSSEVAAWLRGRGLEVWRGISSEGREQGMTDCLDLLVALGGDGTVLRAARLSLACGVPVLPVALGQLNFMAELQPDTLYAGLETLLAGGGWDDTRALLAATVRRGNEPPLEIVALNEVLVARGEIGRVMTIDVAIYQTTLTTYHADGVIIATATGSTAYALSAGGPIVDPRSQALTLVPVAAHLTNIPSLVLAEDAVITLTIRSRHAASLSADGREPVTLHAGDTVEVRRAGITCTFARVHPPSTFYAMLAQRLRR